MERCVFPGRLAIRVADKGSSNQACLGIEILVLAALHEIEVKIVQVDVDERADRVVTRDENFRRCGLGMWLAFRT